MRAATVILVCLVAFLALCFVGAGAFLWQRARVAQRSALYAERVQAEMLAAEQSKMLAALERRQAGEEASAGATTSSETSTSLKEALVAVTYGDENERISGLLALSRQAERSDAVLKALVTALKDDSTVVRNLAATLLGNMGQEAAPAALALSEKLVEPAVRDAALYALRAIGPAGGDAIASLEGLLESAHPEVQEAAKRALEAARGRVGER